jgi:HPt (histidine-containing phosphotransfer) domain-containing protein
MSDAIHQPAFDPSAIEKLKNVAGDQASAFVSEMASLFLEEAGKQIGTLKSASRAGDWKTVNRTAHSMKSSAATLGLLRLSAACRDLETTTKDGPAVGAMALVQVVAAHFEAVVPTLRSLI